MLHLSNTIGRVLFGCIAAAFLFSCSSVQHEDMATPCPYTEQSLDAAFKAGQVDASADVAKGILKIKYWGMRQYYGIEKLFKEKYNIELENVAVCFVSLQDDEYIRGYNSISQKAIQDKYGKDFFEKAYQEALKAYPLKSKADFYDNKFMPEEWTAGGA